MAAWLVPCLVFSSGYGSVMRSTFFLPLEGKSIETQEDILESGIPWNKIIYGSDDEKFLASSSDPVIRAIWDGKESSSFDPTSMVDMTLNRVKLLSYQ